MPFDLQKIDENLRRNRFYRLGQSGFRLTKRIGFLNLAIGGVFLAMAGEHYYSLHTHPRYHHWNFLQRNKVTRTVYETV